MVRHSTGSTGAGETRRSTRTASIPQLGRSSGSTRLAARTRREKLSPQPSRRFVRRSGGMIAPLGHGFSTISRTRFQARADDLVQLLSMENGKVVPEAEFEVDLAA